ncbi:MAG: ATP-binding protein [Armatimonadota bacterium]|nr:ATP-binding protein [Armatimonadota bacterium]
MKVRIALDVPEDHAYVRMIRQIGRTLLEEHQASAEDIDELELIVGELCSNVTRHAHSESGCYHVALEHHGDHIVVLVIDQGQGFDRHHLPAVGSPLRDEDGTLRHGGFGLHLLDRITDRMDIRHSEPKGMTVRAEKWLRRTTEAAGSC